MLCAVFVQLIVSNSSTCRSYMDNLAKSPLHKCLKNIFNICANIETTENDGEILLVYTTLYICKKYHHEKK